MLKRSKKILLEGTLAEFKNYPRGAEGREYVLMNIEEKGPDGSYAFYEKDEKGYIIPVSYKGTEGYDATEFILFTDPEFERIILENFNTNPKGGITTKEANAIVSITLLFKNNTALVTIEDLKFLKNLDTIPTSAFYGCTNLEEVIIPRHIEKLEDYCFCECPNLKVIKIYGDVELPSLGSACFGTFNLDKIEFYGSKTINVELGSQGGNASSAFISNNATLISLDTFKGFTGLTNVQIPNSVTTIGPSAFEGCTGLTSINIPNSVTSIGRDAFKNCTGLTRVGIADLSVWAGIVFETSESNPLYYAHHLYSDEEETKDLVIPDGMTSIGDYTFSNCTGLTSVTIPNSVTSVGKYAFSDCNNLSLVHIEDLISWCNIEFAYLSNPLLFAGHLYINGIKLENLVIPNNVTSIKAYAFCGCKDLVSVELHNDIYSIGRSAFLDCSNLTSFDVPNTITSIANYLFLNCTSLTSVNISSSITEIGAYAFELCTSLTSIDIPESVLYIGGQAFGSCTNLTYIKCHGDTPASISDPYYGSPFSGITSTCTLYVPINSLEAYLTANYWKNFENIVGFESEEETQE